MDINGSPIGSWTHPLTPHHLLSTCYMPHIVLRHGAPSKGGCDSRGVSLALNLGLLHIQKGLVSVKEMSHPHIVPGFIFSHRSGLSGSSLYPITGKGLQDHFCVKPLVPANTTRGRPHTAVGAPAHMQMTVHSSPGPHQHSLP